MDGRIIGRGFPEKDGREDMLILIVDDEEGIRRMLSGFLRREGYTCLECGSLAAAREIMERHAVAAVLLDINLGGDDGFSLLRHLVGTGRDIQVIMVSGQHDIRMAIKAMRLGAVDYIRKPFEFSELSFAVRGALDKRRLILENRNYRANLEGMVKVQAGQIHDTYMNSITALSIALEAKDPYTHGHSLRVTGFAEAILSAMSDTFRKGADRIIMENVHRGGMLHDIGKIGIRELVLHKPTRLNDEEFGIIKKHPELGTRILEPVIREQDVINIVRHHHEHFDGSGYPDGLTGDCIPFAARVISVADAYDAMTSDRPYRRAMTRQAALHELIRGKGTQFDPDIVDAFSGLPVKADQ